MVNLVINDKALTRLQESYTRMGCYYLLNDALMQFFQSQNWAFGFSAQAADRRIVQHSLEHEAKNHAGHERTGRQQTTQRHHSTG
jgi:hypothetical protein